MKSHFRTAVLAIALAGGTLASYVTAYAVMGAAPAAATASVSPSVSSRNLAPGQTDVSVREACAGFDRADARARCMRTIAAAPRPVRVIDFASSDTGTVVR